MERVSYCTLSRPRPSVTRAKSLRHFLDKEKARPLIETLGDLPPALAELTKIHVLRSPIAVD